MTGLIWLVPFVPYAGALVLALAGPWLPRRLVALIGAGTVGVAAVLAMLIGIDFLTAPPPGHVFSQTLWSWIRVDGFAPGIGFHLDPLALVMVLVITVVGFLIHVYATEFMAEEEGYSRFFAYMNLFVGFMLTLVLADNLLLLYLGWEGVGLCSYLLIGFWYQEPANGRAARKAFIVTRVGDTALAVALFLLFDRLGTLHLPSIAARAAAQWPEGSTIAVVVALLVLGGAVGKSAQLPLQTWLPDAMAGPTPVSALIHAATMVTAGVYLIARLHVLFELAPAAMTTVAVVGALTLLLAGCSALTQRDIKRVLAYSTMSQIGYMFLALGVGAWSAAIFHFMTHAFFKALLFLGAGAVSLAAHHQYDMFRLGGLRRQLPLVFWTFLIGAAALAALPLVTAGFYSKDLILWETWASDRGGAVLWGAGLVGALITAVYTFRVVFLTFFGPAHGPVEHRPGPAMAVPLVVLAAFALGIGFVELPPWLGDRPWFSTYLHHVLPALSLTQEGAGVEALLALIAAAASLLGVYLAYLFILQRRALTERLVSTSLGGAVHRWWSAGWGFDWLYDRLFVAPYVWLARADRGDVVDLVYRAVAWLSVALYALIRRTQSGRVRWYAASIAAGAAGIVLLVVIL